jgi:hypothetical protein
MKASDLMIGNWIINGIGEEFQANAQTIGSFFVGEYTVGPFEPIPITEEWLVKFGATEHPNDIHPDRTLYFIGRFLVAISKRGLVAFGIPRVENGFMDRLLCEVRYVHDLQNLYKALTGQDLTIKEHEESN